MSGRIAKFEPCNLREWSVNQGRLLTCGRPGRGHYAAGALPHRGIPEDILLDWADGLGVAKVVHLVSLLGRKSNGMSEFKYYPFRSCEEPDDKPTLQAWLNRIKFGAFVVFEYPTTDYQMIPPDQIGRIVDCVRRLLGEDRTVVLVDSAGAVRTKQVRDAMGFTKLKAALTQSCA